MAIAIQKPVKHHPPIHVVITNHPILAALAVLLALIVIVFLVGDTSSTQSPATVQVDAGDSGSTVQMSAGDTLEISLDGNISTGYSWDIADYDPAVVKPVGEQETVASGPAIGAGEKVITRFEAVGAGQTSIRMIYHRPWETDVAPLKSFVLNVVVGDQAQAAR